MATEWRLYSFRDGALVGHKGFRSQTTGANFIGLVRAYVGSGERFDKIVSAAAPPAEKPTTPASLETLSAKWGARIR